MITTRIRLIALDIDGTLVGSSGDISPRVQAAIVEAKRRGAVTTIVTGRMFQAARPFATTLGITGPVVCYQGAAVFEAGSGVLIRQTPVHQDVTREVIDWALARGVHVQCYAGDQLYLQSVNQFSKRYTDLAKVEPIVVPSLAAAFHDQPSIKIVLVDDPGPSERHLGDLQRLLGARAYLTRSHVDFVEVLSPDVNKGEALGFVAEHYGVTLAETMAVGDAWNDVPLIAAAGIGVAMGSGPPELFAKADAVVGDVAHDGVAEAIERFVLT